VYFVVEDLSSEKQGACCSRSRTRLGWYQDSNLKGRGHQSLCYVYCSMCGSGQQPGLPSGAGSKWRTWILPQSYKLESGSQLFLVHISLSSAVTSTLVIWKCVFIFFFFIFLLLFICAYKAWFISPP
jgi:hypothetical protein